MRCASRKETVSAYKIAGCCSLCDQPAFEVKAVWAIGEKRAGEPKQLGAANQGSARITFLLLDGKRTDMTFCGGCAETLSPEHYPTLWRKNLAGWLREQDGDPEKFTQEFGNMILAELGRITYLDLLGASHGS